MSGRAQLVLCLNVLFLVGSAAAGELPPIALEPPLAREQLCLDLVDALKLTTMAMMFPEDALEWEFVSVQAWVAKVDGDPKTLLANLQWPDHSSGFRGQPGGCHTDSTESMR